MRYLELISTILITLSITGCSSLWNFSGETRSGVSSSLVDYLYPAGEVPPDTSEMIPHLQKVAVINVNKLADGTSKSSHADLERKYEQFRDHLLDQIRFRLRAHL